MFVFSCTTEKNTGLSRGYHNLTSRYNVLFNGWESFDKGMEKLETAKEDDYSKVLPIFIYHDKDEVAGISSEMDRAIKKATKLISKHSITAKPELNDDRDLTPKQREFYNKNEFNKWVDDAYLLMAKAHFYKHEFDKSSETFQYLISNFPESEARMEAGIWLARIALEKNRIKEAENTLFELTEERELPKYLEKDMEATLAYIEVKRIELDQGASFFTLSSDKSNRTSTDKVIEHLYKALESEKSKYYKQRYNFIIAQLLQQSNDGALASEYYQKVIKMNPPYEMTFNARINMALSYESGAVSRRDIEKELQKMLRDDKNIEFQDQIYYAWGNLYFQEGDVDKALEYYILSASVSEGNLLQQARSNLTIADICYDKADYILAQAYYDSTVSVIDMGYPNYNQIYAKSISLSNLVYNVEMVQLQDSVQKLSYMPKDELMTYIDELIEQQKEADILAKELERERLLNEAFNTQQNFELQTNKTGWYFYNPTAIDLGRKEFRKTWGARKLEDNWRRANKSSVDIGADIADAEEGEEAVEGEAGAKKANNKYSRAYYLEDIPLTDSAMLASHEHIKAGLYNAGDIYNQELKDYQKAIAAYEDLLRRYPSYDKRLQVYYKLYTIAKQIEDIAMVSKYQQKITNEFPESNYALVLSDPNYFRKIEEQKQQQAQAYNQIYNDFDKGQYARVSRLIREALDENPESEFVMQYDYMLTVSEGVQKDTLTFISDLEKLVSKYPSTEISERSQQLVSYLKTKNPEAAREQEIQQAVALYSNNANEKHYAVVSLPKSRNVNQLMFNIINFNIDSYSELDLKVKKSEIGADALMQITSFKNQNEAKTYYSKLKVHPELFRDVDSKGSYLFIISESNFSILLRDKKISQYKTFFEQNLNK